MAIDYKSLTADQKKTYDFAVTVGKQSPDDPDLIELLGLIAKPKTRIRKEQHEVKEAISREAEAVLLHLRKTDTLIQKICLQCHLPFATNYVYVGRCSDECLKASLADLGIDWNPEKTAEERWSGREGVDANSEIPAILRPETVAFLKEWAKVILSWGEEHDSIRPADRLERQESVGDSTREFNLPSYVTEELDRIDSITPVVDRIKPGPKNGKYVTVPVHTSRTTVGQVEPINWDEF